MSDIRDPDNRYPDGRCVYVIEILDRWHAVASERMDGRQPCGGCTVLYVGMTGLHAGARYRQHRRGEKAAGIFHEIRRQRRKQGMEATLEDGVDVSLRRDLMPRTTALLDDEAARSLEEQTAAELAAEGHLVFQN